MKEAQQRFGRIRRGWHITQSAWRTLKLDKELAVLLLFSSFISLAIMSAFIVTLIANATITRDPSGNITGASSDISGWWYVVLSFITYLALVLTSNFFNAAVIHGTLERFKGNNPTIRSCLSASKKRIKPLALFSLLAATVGQILMTIEERLPLAGRISTRLFDLAWSIATFFAVPIIVTTSTSINPVKAVKQSAQLIKKVWGEGAVSQLSIGAISALIMFVYIVVFIALAVIGAQLSAPTLFYLSLATVGVLGLVGLVILFNTLHVIAQAAVFHFATTSEAPELFNKALLRSAMTTHKARKVFSQ